VPSIATYYLFYFLLLRLELNMLAVLVKLIGCSIMESYKMSILFPCLLDSDLLM